MTYDYEAEDERIARSIHDEELLVERERCARLAESEAEE